MSEVKLNLIDAEKILTGTIHGSVADACVAALSAEPETIEELAHALGRYHKPDETHGPFAWFRSNAAIDSRPYDAGIVIIDLAARVVGAESTYSRPDAEGSVSYHDGTCATEFSIPYRLTPDWLFVNSTEAYEWSHERRVSGKSWPRNLSADGWNGSNSSTTTIWSSLFSWESQMGEDPF